VTKKTKRPAGPQLLIDRPMTPAVKSIGQIAGMIEGNVTPHVWYHRSEFMTPAGRPDHNLITAIADILYWYRPQQVRDEENGGVFVGWARKFQRDMLQYNYEERAEVFGMTKRQMQDACTLAAKRGLIRIEYRTESFRGKLYHNIVYVEPVAETLAATLSEPNFQHVEKAKGATRGRHKPNPGIDDLGGDEEPEVVLTPVSYSGNQGGTSLNLERLEFWSGHPTSLNFGRLTSLNFGTPLSKFRDTYHDTSVETNFFSRDFKNSGGGNFVLGEAAVPPQEDSTPPEALDRTTTTGAQGADTAAPEGVAADAAQANPSRESADPPTPKAGESEPAKVLEQIPGPGAAAEVRKILQPLLGGERSFNDRLAERPPSGITRPDWLKIPPARAAELAVAAQAEFETQRQQFAGGTSKVKPNLWSSLILLLDMEIGYVPGSTTQSSGADKRPAAGAAAPRAPEPEPERPEQAIDVGSRWEHKRLPDEVVTLVAVKGGKVELHNGKELASYLLLKDFQRVH